MTVCQHGEFLYSWLRNILNLHIPGHLGLGDKTGGQDWNAPLPAALGDLGFDYHYIMAATADRVPCVFIENGKVANYDPSDPIGFFPRKRSWGKRGTCTSLVAKYIKKGSSLCCLIKSMA